uniref:ATP synthase complex subunit 8 n=1 Tax=Maesaipsyche stengeli TaxID=2904894 RepID=A0A9E8LNI4_9NEOP|nr:ATP synthase F0 subunit 8 [Maesaipsyche stengeli]UZZ43652.1 ATP synthase F0 subunit 8 [Maesaipsyche stengeli]
MPQIMPLNWIMLIFYFSLLFYWINSIIFYNYLKTPNNYSMMNTPKFKTINWKW